MYRRAALQVQRWCGIGIPAWYQARRPEKLVLERFFGWPKGAEERAIDGVLDCGGLAGEETGDFVRDAQAQIEADEFEREGREAGIEELLPALREHFAEEPGEGDAANMRFGRFGGGAGHAQSLAGLVRRRRVTRRARGAARRRGRLGGRVEACPGQAG